MISNPFYSHEFHGDYNVVSIGGLDLEEGGRIPDCQLAVATFGELNAAKDNAILITSWYSGTHQIWRDIYIGPEHALNPERYFIVAVTRSAAGFRPLRTTPTVPTPASPCRSSRMYGSATTWWPRSGSCASTSASSGWPWSRAARWARSRPMSGPSASPTRSCAPRHRRNRAEHPHDFLLAETMREAIMSDPGWNGGEYASNADVAAGLIRQAHLWAVVGFSTEFWKQEVWRVLEFDSRDAFITGFLEPYFTVMDPNDLLTQSWKWQRGDVARHSGGDLAAALGRITAKVFVMPIDEDLLFPVRDCLPEQALIKGSELRVIEDIQGHLALFGVAPTYMPQIDQHLSELLATQV